MEAEKAATERKRGIAKLVEGRVTSDSMEKTIVVSVVTKVKHPAYGKYISRTKKYVVHDEQNECNVGDRVLIVETRPLSKRKRWRLREVVEKAL